jgi:D-tagatose-1,6-bisphosphate aldolase subunit GatZ/KbaZ
MRQAAADETTVLIEATCNQVNHEGGYTGFTPVAFRDQVHNIADEVGFPRQQIVLGGDHLGPNPWRHLPAEVALAQAEAMVAAYVAAGYEKIHIDTSMGCQGEPDHLPDSVTAERAARLAVVAQTVASSAGTAPRYVIGTEVPVPGGAREAIDHLEVTRPEAVAATLEAHRLVFAAAGAEAAFEAVIALVAQPGVEFDDRSVVVYKPERARKLSAALGGMPGLVFEAHSTDYQPAESLARLVSDGFAILKVGPGLTFALREALYGLDQIATALYPSWSEHSLVAEMEREMLANPRYWQSHYQGDPEEQRVLRHFSYSDRIRYYWASSPAQDAVRRLLERLTGTSVPAPLISQFLPTLYPRVANGTLDPTPRTLVLEAVRDVLRVYAAACGETKSAGRRSAPGSGPK